MSGLESLVLRARQQGDPSLLAAAVPFAGFIGVVLASGDEGQLTARLPFAEHLVGNPGVPALHGGTLSALLETAAVMKVLWEVDPIARPRTINLTTNYLRPAALRETHAAGTFLRVGRRVIVVDVQAWQSDPRRPVAVARVHLMVG